MVSLKDFLQDDFSRSSQAMILGDDTGKAYATNTAASRLFGYSEEEILLEGRNRIVQQDVFFCNYIEERRKFGSAVGVVNCRRKSGEEFRALIASRKVESDNDLILYLISFTALQDYEKHYGTQDDPGLIAQVAGWEYDIEKKIFYSDHVCQLMPGLPDCHFFRLERALRFLSDPLKKLKLEINFEQSISGGSDWEDEFSVNPGTGALRWFKVRCFAVRTNGRTLALRGTVQDITAFKRLEELQRKDNADLDYLLNNSRNLLSIRDENFRIIYCNEHYRELFGYDFQELQEMKINDLVHIDDLDRTMRMLNRLKSGHSVESFRNRIINSKGEILEISWNITWHEDRKRMYIVGTNTTKADHERKFATLQQINSQEEEKQEIFVELHDNICQTLAAARIFLGNYMNYGGDANLQQAMHLLTEGLGATRSLAAVQLYPDLQYQSFAQALKFFFEQVNRRNNDLFSFRILGHWGKDIPNEVKTMLYRIVQELASNIIQYSHATEAVITLNREDDLIYLVASDNGIGASSQELANDIYFNRMHSRIDVLGGQFEIQTEPGKGFRVVMEFDLTRIGLQQTVRLSSAAGVY